MGAETMYNTSKILTCIMAEEMRASERCGPGGIVTKWLPVPSRPLTVSTNFFNISAFSSTSPNDTTSTLTFSFLSFLATFISSFSSESMGDPIKVIILVL